MYLSKDYKVQTTSDINTLCEIPEGADFYAKDKMFGKECIYFYKDNSLDFSCGAVFIDNKWHRCQFNKDDQTILWQRKSTGTLVEYLDPSTWTLHTVDVDNDAAGEDWIKVPEGAVMYFQWNQNKANAKFHDRDGNILGEDAREIPWTIEDLSRWSSDVLWQRSFKPEELPFVDDEPKDNVNHPSHYTQGNIECIEAIKASMSHDAYCGYLKGNVQKYMWRYEHKGGVESLKKAQWYLSRLIKEQSQ